MVLVQPMYSEIHKATPSGNTVSGQGLSQVKRRAGGFSHYVIILLSEQKPGYNLEWPNIVHSNVNS